MQKNVIHSTLPNWEGDYSQPIETEPYQGDYTDFNQDGGIDFSKVDFASIWVAPKENGFTLREAELINAYRTRNL